MKLQKLLFVRSCVPNRVQPLERRNARTQKNKVHFFVQLRGHSKIRNFQSMVVQTVKNPTVNRTQIIIR